MVLLCVYVEQGHVDSLEIYLPAPDLQLALDESVLLVQFVDKLAECLAGLVGAVKDPFLHFEEAL